MNKTEYQIITGDITTIHADAIVNPTDSSYSGTGGLDFAIHRAAGRELAGVLHASRKLTDGEAIITPAFEIKTAKWIIHTVGPKWKKGFDFEEFTLAECYRNSLRIAVDHKCESIAFPCISVGSNGFPMDRAAEIAVRTVVNTLQGIADYSSIRQIFFVCSEKHAEIYKKHFKKAIIDSFLHYYSPESLPYYFSDKYYDYMGNLALLEWGDIKCHHRYHSCFGKIEHSDHRNYHSAYDHYARNLDSWDYNTCLAYLIEIFRPPFSYDGTELILPHYAQCKNGTVRRILIRMKTLVG